MTLKVGQRKKNDVTAAMFRGLFFSLIITPFSVGLVETDRFYIMTLRKPLGNRTADGATKPPVILISAPENDTVFTEARAPTSGWPHL